MATAGLSHHTMKTFALAVGAGLALVAAVAFLFAGVFVSVSRPITVRATLSM